MKIKDFIRCKWEIIGPVLKPGKKGEWDDFAAISPIVQKHPKKKGRYIMYYMGQSWNSRNWSIGYAKSFNLVYWTKHKEPIISYKDKNNILLFYVQSCLQIKFKYLSPPQKYAGVPEQSNGQA